MLAYTSLLGRPTRDSRPAPVRVAGIKKLARKTLPNWPVPLAMIPSGKNSFKLASIAPANGRCGRARSGSLIACGPLAFRTSGWLARSSLPDDKECNVLRLDEMVSSMQCCTGIQDRAAEALKAVLHQVSQIKLKGIDVDSPHADLKVDILAHHRRARAQPHAGVQGTEPAAGPSMSAWRLKSFGARPRGLPETRRRCLLRLVFRRRLGRCAGKARPAFSTWKGMRASTWAKSLSASVPVPQSRDALCIFGLGANRRSIEGAASSTA